jgi:hypothetical protein
MRNPVLSSYTHSLHGKPHLQHCTGTGPCGVGCNATATSSAYLSLAA